MQHHNVLPRLIGGRQAGHCTVGRAALLPQVEQQEEIPSLILNGVWVVFPSDTCYIVSRLYRIYNCLLEFSGGNSVHHC